MLVAFWSSAEIRAGVTTNAALISHFYAQRYKGKVALFENHVPGKYGLDDILIGKKHLSFLFEEPIYYNRNSNINYYYGLMKAGLPVDGLSDAALQMVDGKLHYFPQFSSNHNLFDYEMNKIIDRLLDELDARYDVVFSDLKRLHTMTTKKIIERANLVFINVPQEESDLESILREYSIDRNKVCFIISRYKKEGNRDFNEFISHIEIDNETVYYIPYCEALAVTCKNGNLSSFLSKNLWSVRGEKSYELISQLRKLTTLIKTRTDYNMEMEMTV